VDTVDMVVLMDKDMVNRPQFLNQNRMVDMVHLRLLKSQTKLFQSLNRTADMVAAAPQSRL